MVEKAIELKNVDRIYKKGKNDVFYALKDLTINIERGKIFCLLGPNGSGKTTTINLINGLNKPTNGSVSVMGYNPINDMKKVRRLLGIVPQETALYNDLTAKENLLFHAQYYGVEKSEWKPRIESMLDLVGLKERQDDRVGTFSGGMQRRLSLARALITSPEIILLDEPTLGVDVHSRNAIWSKIKELAKEGKTILLSTNYMEEAEALADIIYIIDKGQNITSGSLQQLKEEVGQKKLFIGFEAEEEAKSLFGQLKDEYQVSIDHGEITVSLTSKEQFYTILHDFNEHIEKSNSFSLMEPSLNDVFLHFTGRDLRD